MLLADICNNISNLFGFANIVAYICTVLINSRS